MAEALSPMAHYGEKRRKTLNNIIIRKEKSEDYKASEYLALRAFWNLHGPGCNEHYLVHILRNEKCYVEELSRVAECDERIVGLIMYSRAKVVDGDKTHEVLSFGPLCVEPTFCSMGIGERLLEETIKAAKEAGYPGIIIYGEPGYYPRHGFKTCDNYNITTPDGGNFEAFMAYPLDEERFSQIHGKFYEDEAFGKCNDLEAVEEFTAQFVHPKPLKLACQWLHKERLGTICEVQKNSYTIKYWEKELSAKLKGSFYRAGSEFAVGSEFPVVGDYVTFIYNPVGDSVITSVCERRSVLKRPYPSDHVKAHGRNMDGQVMVANFDYVFIAASLNGSYNFNRIARYVSIALQGNGIPVVILTKVDLCSNPGRYVRELEGLSDKVRVHTISALYGIGLDELKEYLKPEKTIAILGSSGVGKSTLVNALCGEEAMKTSEIRESDSKGRHTTTYRQMFELQNGARIIDTPGMRELGMCDVDEGIDETFSDISELEAQCKFRNCRHDTEPGCAVKAAIKAGALSKERYELYRKLHAESSHAAKLKAIAKQRRKL